VSTFTNAVAKVQASLEIAEDAIRTIGAVGHHVADQLADKVREFRDGYEQGYEQGGKGGDDAAR
jgi:hypothetical protein